MKHIYCVCATKGGVGKSVSSATLAEAAALDGKKVLCIDMDPQASLSFMLDADPEIPTVYSVLNGRDPEETIQSTASGVDLIAGSGDLIELTTTTGSARRLEKALESIESQYDFIIIDSGPRAGEAMNNALFAARGVLIPVDTDLLGLNGFYTMVEIVRQVQKTKRGLRYIGVLVCQYDGRPIAHRQLRDMIEEYAEEVGAHYLGEVRRCVKVRESIGVGEPLLSYAPDCTSARDYMRIYKEIMEEAET